MPRNIYSTRFAIGNLNSTYGYSKSFVVPAGKVAILSYVQFHQQVGAPVVLIEIWWPPGPISTRVVKFTAATVDQVYAWTGRIVANAGDEIRLTNTTAGTSSAGCHASGYLLTA